MQGLSEKSLKGPQAGICHKYVVLFSRRDESFLEVSFSVLNRDI